MTYTTETRFLGPGLPAEGVAGGDKAYRLALTDARLQAVYAWQRTCQAVGMIHPQSVAENWEELVRAVSDATDAFVEGAGSELSDVIDALKEGERDGMGNRLDGAGEETDYRHVEREAGIDAERGVHGEAE